MRYLIVAVIFIFLSCSNNSENNLRVFRVAEEGLQQSIESISANTDMIYFDFKRKSEDFQTKEIASNWMPKAIEVKRLSDSLVKYIRKLKEELKNKAGGSDLKNKNWQNNLKVSSHVLNSLGRGKELFENLLKYRKMILAVDPKINNQFAYSINVFSNEFDAESSDAAVFTKTFFSDNSVIAAFVMLSKLESNIKIIENLVVKFCFYQIGYLDRDAMVDKYEFLVGQNSNYLKVGDELEISAGMGSYTVENNPAIIINGKLIPLSDYGGVTYKFKTPKKPGKYFVPVRIEYTNKRDGKRESFKKKIEYTVIE